MILNQLQTGHTETSLNPYDTLASGDGFGYVGQLAGYAKASGKRAGGWWVVNKANGHLNMYQPQVLTWMLKLLRLKDTVKQ